MGITPFEAAAVLIVLVATLAFINQRFIGLPQSVAMTGMAAVASLIVMGVDQLMPKAGLSNYVVALVDRIDFQTTLLNGMLSFLLFAGALHVNWTEMRRGQWPILILSTLGVIVSTLVVGTLFWLGAGLLGISIPLIWSMVFGALISPTDPVAVIGVLKRTKCPPTLEATVAGESLFNDGVGVVIFTIVLAAAMSGQSLSLVEASQQFVVQALGGVGVGLAVGYAGFLAMRSIDEYNVELMITLAIVMGGYALAQRIDVSGPVAMAVAGLLIGNAGVAHAMDEVTRDHVLKFWALIDELLNAVLFLLIGLEIVAISPEAPVLRLALMAVPVVLLGRVVSVLPPLYFMRSIIPIHGPSMPALLWGGLRGGISVAMALSLSNGPEKPVVLTATYIVVLFSVIVQGATVGPIVERSVRLHGCS